MPIENEPEFIPAVEYLELGDHTQTHSEQILKEWAIDNLLQVSGGRKFLSLDRYDRRIANRLQSLNAAATGAPCPCDPLDYLDFAEEMLGEKLAFIRVLSYQPHRVGASLDRATDVKRIDAAKKTCQMILDNFLMAIDCVFAAPGTNECAQGGQSHEH